MINSQLALIGQHLPENKKRQFETIQNLVILRGLITDYTYKPINTKVNDLLLYGSDKKSNDPEEKLGYKTYLRILTLLYGTRDSLRTVNFEVDAKVETHPLNTIPDDNLISVFELLVNLYSNTRDNTETEFAVKITCEESKLCIIFQNEGVIQDKYKIYVLGGDTPDGYSRDGLKVIRENIEKLKQTHKLIINTDKDNTFFILSISSL
jgi:hypothetical protein